MEQALPKVKKFAVYLFAAVGGLAVLLLVANLFFSDSFIAQRKSPIYDAGAPSSSEIRGTSPLDFGSALLGEKSSSPSSQSAAGRTQEGALTQRKVVKNGSLSLLVGQAEDVAEKIQGVAASLGGFVTSSNIYEVSSGIKSGIVTIRVPASRFDEAIAGIKKLAVKVDSESISAQDVTEQYIDLEARLKNARVEEEQYLEIMKKSWAIADTIQVAQRLAEVRGRIESLQGQLQFLSRQVDMSTITATLTAEADVEVFGIRWRPLFVAKQSLRRMLTGVADYVDAMIAFVFALPVIILWLATAAVALFAIWKLSSWVRAKFFGAGRES